MDFDRITIIFGATYDDYVSEYTLEELEEYWNFSEDDFLHGSIEPNPNMEYWYIDGRFYEGEKR